MLRTSIRQFPMNSKEHGLLWNQLNCNKPSTTSAENSGKDLAFATGSTLAQ